MGMKDEEIVLKAPTFGLKCEYEEIEYKLAHLLLEEVIFCNNGWWFNNDGVFWPKDYITLHVNCNDVFAWGASDCENVTYKEIGTLYEMYKKDPLWGPAAWCIMKRKQLPQLPVQKRIEDDKIWNLQDLIKE
jgi:hypothetical protein